MVTNRVYLVICEGDSEVAYVQELNRFLNEQGKFIVFQAVNAGGGGFTTIRQCCRDRKTRKNGRTFVIVDKDIYVRNDNGAGENYEKEKDVLPPFLFQTWNFEDFLLMHFPRDLVVEWRELSAINGHLTNPKHSVDYAPMYAEFCSRYADQLQYDLPYEKGDMPFALTVGHMANLFANNEADFPHSQFAELIKKVQEG